MLLLLNLDVKKTFKNNIHFAIHNDDNNLVCLTIS